MKINSITFQVKLQRRSLGMLVFMKESILPNFQILHQIYAKSPVLSYSLGLLKILVNAMGLFAEKSITQSLEYYFKI